MSDGYAYRIFGKGLPLRLSVYDAAVQGFGGWTLSPHHFYDPEGAIVFKGDGTERKSHADSIRHLHGLPFNPSLVSNGPFYAMPDGSLRLANAQGVYSVDETGQIETWENSGEMTTMVPDGPDAMFVGSIHNLLPKTLKRLERINGAIVKTSQVTLPSTSAALALGPDNLVYVLLNTNPIAVHRYTRGLLPADAGPLFTLPGDSSQAASSAMSFDGDTLLLAVGNAGGIFEYSAAMTTPLRIANGGKDLIAGQDALTTRSNNNTLYHSVHRTPRGVIFTARDARVWLIDKDNKLQAIAGDPNATAGSGDGGPAVLAGLGVELTFDIAPDDSVYVYTRSPGQIRQIQSSSPAGFTSAVFSVPSEEGKLLYDFAVDGHHLRTRDVRTGIVIYSFEYEDGLLSAIVHGDADGPSGASLPRTSVLRDVPNQVTVVAPSGQRTRININPSTGYASQVIDADGGRRNLSHDADGLLLGMTDPDGFVHAYSYDDLGQLISDTGPGLAPQTLSGIPRESVQLTNGEGEVSSYSLELDQVSGKVTRNTQNSDGSSTTTSVTSPLDRSQIYSDGTTIAEKYALHPTFDLNAPILVSRRTTLPSGLSMLETHGLTIAGDIWTETSATNGKTVTHQMNQGQRTSTVTSPEGRRVTTVLDAQGRAIQIQMGNLAPVHFSYDSEGRLMQSIRGTGPEARATTLDYFADDTGAPNSGYLMSVTDAEQGTVSFTRDAFGRPLSTSRGSETTQFSYSAAGKLETLTTPAGDTHIQNYSGVGRLTEYVSPGIEGTDDLMEYSYDNARRLSSASLPGNIGVTVTRDGGDPEAPERKGRLRSVSSPNSGNGTLPFRVEYAYADEVVCIDPEDPENCPIAGPAGQLSEIIRGDIRTALTFDGPIPVYESHSVEPGSLTHLADTGYGITLNNSLEAVSSEVKVDGVLYTASMTYDADSLLTCAGYGGSCAATQGVVFNFDNGPQDPSPDGHGQLESTLSGEVSETFSYNAFGELATHDVSIAGAPLRSTVYHEEGSPRDQLGRVVTKTVTQGLASASTNYGYDELGQLIQVAVAGEPSRNYKYDANGNRLCMVEAPAIDCDEEATYDAQDRLISSNGVEYLYTDRGTLFQRLEAGNVQTFSYDALGNLIRVEGVDGNTLFYIIDGEGHRVAKLVNAQLQKQYVWSSSLRIEAELDGTGRLTSRFIYGNRINVPDLVVKPDPSGDKFYRIITDQLGSPVYVVNIHDSDDVLLEASYDEWGQVTQYTSSTGQWPLPFAFAGGLFDEDTGLVRFGARDYDPRVGRWTAKDPILFGGGQANLYVYVGNDPVGSVDPEGQSKFDRWYGAPKRLKKWFHRQHKDTHGPDADKKGVKDACDEWNREGQPGPDNKRGRTRKKQTPPDEDPWDDLDIIIPFPDLPSPCDYSGGLFPDLCGGSST